MADTGLCFDALTLTHRDGRPLIALTHQIAPGQVLSLMGPSGVGKSTLLSAITGTLPPAFTQRGTIELNGRCLNQVPPQNRRVGILFQDHLLFPHMSVGENLAFGLHCDARDRRDHVCEALEEIDLAGFEDRDPATLSGGQRARVALMRMLLSNPEALLLDEPFSRLDSDLRHRMRDLVFSRARDAGLPVVLVTHDIADTDAAAGEVIHLSPSR